ncbi:hypothetical protein CB1_02 [Pectobacterium phage vB_PatP_CB1]|uniref:Uncharacterized protein n=1 Tax=Pectobacterium phage vB_PatP_CB1 TaxID=1958917 RepID=A0A2P0PAM8_9CAUD|nr:hypothetical protein HWB08_gp02 [Pectobacterium phage vB_PatP_CB1]ARB11729.1 hypothetical protein CB1_02 [Pectobacterium phage vB_PatP_CB1]
MRTIKTSVMFFPADPVVVTKTKRDWMLADMASPAQWSIAVDVIVDADPMSASMHQYAFATKPTAKQVRQCKRKAIIEHERDLAQFMSDHLHYF